MFMRNLHFRGAERSFNYNAAISAAVAAGRKNVAHRTVNNNDLPSSEKRIGLPKLRLMLLFETLLVRGGYNSGVALKWPRVQQPSSISNILQRSEIRLLVFFPHSALTVPILPFTLFLLIHHFSLFSSIYPSIHAPGSSSRLPLPRVHSCLLVARTSLPTVNGSFPFSPCRRFAPLLEILVARRFSILLPFLFFYFDHLLPFLKSLFTRHASGRPKRHCSKVMSYDRTYRLCHMYVY